MRGLYANFETYIITFWIGTEFYKADKGPSVKIVHVGEGGTKAPLAPRPPVRHVS